MALTAEQKKKLEKWTTHYPYPIMGLLEAVREVQDWNLCVTMEDEKYLAELFKTTLARVHEVSTFFPMFTRKPTGKARIGVCQGLSCEMAGSKKVCERIEKQLGVREHETTKDGAFSWEQLQCIGACDFAPAIQVNDRLKGKATDEKLAEVLRK